MSNNKIYIISIVLFILALSSAIYLSVLHFSKGMDFENQNHRTQDSNADLINMYEGNIYVSSYPEIIAYYAMDKVEEMLEYTTDIEDHDTSFYYSYYFKENPQTSIYEIYRVYFGQDSNTFIASEEKTRANGERVSIFDVIELGEKRPSLLGTHTFSDAANVMYENHIIEGLDAMVQDFGYVDDFSKTAENKIQGEVLIYDNFIVYKTPYSISILVSIDTDFVCVQYGGKSDNSNDDISRSCVGKTYDDAIEVPDISGDMVK